MQQHITPFEDFRQRFKLMVSKQPHLLVNTLSNIFTMRLIGNKTHGDLAEIGMVEFINQFMYDFKSTHVGKDRFRAKEHEEDITIMSEISGEEFPVSLKAYGDGPLQLSTDSEQQMFPFLQRQGVDVQKKKSIQTIFASPAFTSLKLVHTLPLIYNEKAKQCNIMVFDFNRAQQNVRRIVLIGKNQFFDADTQSVIEAKGRLHPVYLFLDEQGKYIFEVRYGGKDANALQRGLWTHTKNALPYFESLTGWINYEHNLELVQLFRLALNASPKGHKKANTILQDDIDILKRQ
jgi:hypothetical protein